MNRSIVILGGVIALALLSYSSVRYLSPAIEKDISGRLDSLYEQQRIDWAITRADGRDVTLQGEAPSNEEMLKAIELAGNLDGVRVVYNRQTIAGQAEADTAESVAEVSDFSTGISLKDNRVVLTGQVPDQESMDLLLTLAEEQFGPGKVTNSLEIAPGATEEWRQVVSTVLMNLAGFQEAAAGITSERLTLHGVARDQQTADMVREYIQSSLPDSFQSDFTIGAVAVTAVEDLSNTGVELQQTFAETALAPDSELPPLDEMFQVEAMGSESSELEQGSSPVPTETGDMKETLAESAVDLAMQSPPLEEAPQTETALIDDNGEEEEKSRCLSSINALLEGKRINFRFDSNHVHEEHNPMLDTIIAVTILCPHVTITVEGHTDSVGSMAYNQKLSERRAGAGVKVLNERGIWEWQLESIGYGETRPIASNKTRAGRAKNRRIEFKVRETEQ